MKYKVGDKVRVKSWEQMAEEFGGDSLSIDTPHWSFIRDMKQYCNNVYTIKHIDENSNSYRLSDTGDLKITDEMLLPTEETNAEHYHDDIWRVVLTAANFGFDRNKRQILKCIELGCENCEFCTVNCDCSVKKREWLNTPYTESISWNEIPVDTKVLVKNLSDDVWRKRYFAKYENNLIYTWAKGTTSWNADGTMSFWDMGKLVEE